MENFQSDSAVKISIAITITIENLIRINQSLMFFFQPDFDEKLLSRP